MEVAVRAALERLENMFGIVADGKDEDFHAGKTGFELGDEVQPGPARQFQVEQKHIGSFNGDVLEGDFGRRMRARALISRSASKQ